MKKIINSHDEFVDVINILENYAKKVTLLGSFDKFTPEEDEEYDTLAYAVADYEDSLNFFPSPSNLPFEKTILVHMMNRRMKVGETAARLGISEIELSEILAGKRHISSHLNEKIHRVLDITPQEKLVTA